MVAVAHRAAWGIAALCIASRAWAMVDDSAMLRSKPALVRMSYEVLGVAPHESMGLAGVHYLVNVDPNWYMGVSGFGAVEGRRGGFFTGGFTAGTGIRFASRWLLDAGLFVGGGGGGAAPQGGGLMVRPHLGISRDVGRVMVGTGVSYVRFPNGGIDSTQLDITLGIPFDVYYGRAQDAGKAVGAQDLFDLRPAEAEWAATAGEYRPRGGTQTTAGGAMATSLKRIGFEHRRYAHSHRYFLIETAGAAGGQSDGYAELLAGMGYRVPFMSPRLHLDANVTAGAAGGGQMDTGGGLVAKARAGLDYDLTKALTLGAEVGRIESAGSFSADFYGVRLGYRLGEVVSGEGQGVDLGDRVRLARWRLVGSQQTDLAAARKNGPGQSLGLVGARLEKFVSRSVYLLGQAQGAYSGGAGGYAVGLIGAGWEIPLRKDGRLSFNAELAAGAAGGGGVDVAGGAIVQPQAGLTWRLSPALGVRLEAGRVKALDGKLDSTVVGAGLLYEFSRPEYRAD